MTDAIAGSTLHPVPPRTRASAPPWLWAGGAFLVLAGVALALPRWAHPSDPQLLVVFEVRLLIEGAAYLWAAGRRELPPALRRVLLLTGGISIVSLLTNLPLLGLTGPAPEWVVDALDVWLFISYMLSALALLLWPRIETRRWDALTLLLDLVITAGAMGALVLIEVTFPLADATPGATEARWSLIYGLAQVASLAGLSVMVVRGRPLPSRRAFWWFVAAQAAYLPALLLSQLGMAEVITQVAGRVLYVVGVLPALVAAVFIRRDPVTLDRGSAGPPWLRDLSPLPLVTPVLVVVALLNAMTAGPASRVQPLIAMLIITTLLLVIRVLLSAGESAARLRDEGERERRLQREKLATVGRLAGGLAHEFNNMMTVVAGHAEFAEQAVPAGHAAQADLAVIREQSERAARLTRQLLSFSGQQLFQLEAVPVARLLAELRAALEPAVTCEAAPGVEFLAIRADLPLLVAAVQQLTRNALEAGGAAPPVLRLAAVAYATALDSPYLPVPAGRHLSLSVRDAGSGIAPEDLPRLFDPFFTRKPVHSAGGLGLAEVYGVAVGHHGGITVASTVGQGTTVTLYLPFA